MNDWKSGTFTWRDFLGTTLGAAAGFSIYPTGHRLLREILEPASNTFTPFQFPKNFLWDQMALRPDCGVLATGDRTDLHFRIGDDTPRIRVFRQRLACQIVSSSLPQKGHGRWREPV